MHIHVAKDGALSVHETDDLKRFHIEPASATLTDAIIAKALGPIATREGADFWIDTGKLRVLSGRAADAAWVARFDAMLQAAGKYGWTSADGSRVKAHVRRG